MVLNICDIKVQVCGTEKVSSLILQNNLDTIIIGLH